jgi:hypothetical protein
VEACGFWNYGSEAFWAAGRGDGGGGDNGLYGQDDSGVGDCAMAASVRVGSIEEKEAPKIG